MAVDSWHYPRDDFTRRLIVVIDEGPAKALTMFGPRRTGKTQFLTNDLGPMAERRGFRVIYASFWQSTGEPLATLLHETARALKTKSFVKRLADIASFDASIALKGSVPGFELNGAVATAAPTAGKNPLLELDDHLEALAKHGGKVLLLLDEIQELSSTPGGKALIAGLRTSLDRRQDKIKAVFTGSSRDGLDAIFTRREAPFFHFATQIDLPPLDDGFVDHLLRQFARATGRQIDRGIALDAFQRLDRNPEHFRSILEQVALLPDVTFAQALTNKQDALEAASRSDARWNRLDAMDRTMLKLIARGDRPFAEAARALLAAATGNPGITRSMAQSVVKRLAREQLVENRSGRWDIVDSAFRTWLAAQPVS